LLNYSDVEKYFKLNKPDIIIHAAGIVGGIQANILNPVKFLVDNIDIGRNVLIAARETNIKKFINLASSCMYPRAAKNPLTENLVLQGELEPTNEGYALAKIFSTRLCEYISREEASFLYKTLIPSNLYGFFDKFDPKNSHMLPAVIKKIHDAKEQGLKSVDIWGDGKAKREFMFAEDLVDFIFFSIENLEKLPQNINVGVSKDYSINEYYEVIAKIVGYNGKFIHDISKPVGMKQKLIDSSKANGLGWKPKTSLEEGIKKTYEYYRKEILKQ
ncbi:MAG: GDP-fucose synthetase, partial [Flavobacteriaceae bacterium CG17_big_fil_post_rev_8_21_14_2_50_33_15]